MFGNLSGLKSDGIKRFYILAPLKDIVTLSYNFVRSNKILLTQCKRANEAINVATSPVAVCLPRRSINIQPPK